MGGMTLDGARLRRELRALGVPQGSVLLTHCSLRSVGRVDGGAATLLDALLKVLGEDGTLVVPAQTRSKSATSTEFLRAVSGLAPAERERYLDLLPGFDPAVTPSEGMGALAEAVRSHPAAGRSAHPSTSFAALGRHAAELTASHPIESFLGDDSPLGWMDRAGAYVLLLGVGYDKCTAFHLGEDRSFAPLRGYRFKIGDQWRDVPLAPDYDDSDFMELGARFEVEHKEEIVFGPVGAATCRLFPLTAAARFAEKWLPETRRGNARPSR
jgi:aminoglycoside 3-N-acetyltransferase